jgi:small multidrug resistance pump
MQSAFFLTLAIVSEVIATSALKLSQGFTKPGPSAVVIAGYIAAFYLLSLSLRTIPLGLAYAVWAGAGTVLVVAAGVIIWREPLDLAKIAGTLLIIGGILILNLSSKH